MRKKVELNRVAVLSACQSCHKCGGAYRTHEVVRVAERENATKLLLRVSGLLLIKMLNPLRGVKMLRAEKAAP